MITDDRLRVRISTTDKVRAMERAAQQGMTLSEGIRVLLLLWCEGVIDLRALGDLPTMPSEAAMHSLGENLDKLTLARESSREAMRAFQGRDGSALGLAEKLRKLVYW